MYCVWFTVAISFFSKAMQKICQTLLIFGRFLYFDIPVGILERKTLFLEFNYMLIIALWAMVLGGYYQDLNMELIVMNS